MSDPAPVEEKEAITDPEALSDDESPGIMTIWEHLEELRTRLLRSVVVVTLIFGVIAFVFAGDILQYLSGPYRDVSGRPLQVLEPTENIVIYFRVALMSAAIVSVPYLTYELLAFIVPGLTNKERRVIFTALPVATFFFLAGVAFTWFVMIPAAFEFLTGFQDEVFVTEWTARRYIAFLTSILFWMGVAFEMPVVMYVLGRLGLIGAATLIQGWRFAIVAIAVVAALITPTVDPFNMLLVMGPLMALYGLSIIFVIFAQRALRRGMARQ